MPGLEPSRGLDPRDFTEQRNDAMREGAKALLLMNGGGAVALLAFLQAIWKDNPMLARYVVVGLAVLSVGVLLAGLVQLFRYQASFSFQGGRANTFRAYRRLYLGAAYLSLVTFLAAMVVVVRGAWYSLG